MEPSKIEEFIRKQKDSGADALTCTQKWVQAMYDIGVHAWNPIDGIWPSTMFIKCLCEIYPDAFPISVDIWIIDMQMDWRAKNPNHVSCS